MYNQNPYLQNTTVIKNYCRRPLVLFYIILGAICVVTNAIMSVVTGSFISSLTNSIIEANYYSADSSPYLNDMVTSVSNVTSILSAGISLLVACLPIVAIILIYTKSKNPTPSSNPKGPFTFLWILTLIGMITTCISLFFALVVSCMTSITSNIFFLSLVITMAAVALSLLYVIYRFLFVSSIKSSANSIYLKTGGATGYGTLSVIMGVFTLLCVPIMVVIAILGNRISYTSGLNLQNNSLLIFGIAAAVALVFTSAKCFIEATLAFGYKKYINTITRETITSVEVSQDEIETEDIPVEESETVTQPENETVEENDTEDIPIFSVPNNDSELIERFPSVEVEEPKTEEIEEENPYNTDVPEVVTQTAFDFSNFSAEMRSHEENTEPSTPTEEITESEEDVPVDETVDEPAHENEETADTTAVMENTQIENSDENSNDMETVDTTPTSIVEEPVATVSDEADDKEGASEEPFVPTFCSKCGNKLGDEDIFCNKCGNKVR